MMFYRIAALSARTLIVGIAALIAAADSHYVTAVPEQHSRSLRIQVQHFSQEQLPAPQPPNTHILSAARAVPTYRQKPTRTSLLSVLALAALGAGSFTDGTELAHVSPAALHSATPWQDIVDRSEAEERVAALDRRFAQWRDLVESGEAKIKASQPALDTFSSKSSRAMRSLASPLTQLDQSVQAAAIRRKNRREAESVCLAHPETGNRRGLEPVYFPRGAASKIAKLPLQGGITPACATLSFTNERAPHQGETFTKNVVSALMRLDLNANGVVTAWRDKVPSAVQNQLGGFCDHFLVVNLLRPPVLREDGLLHDGYFHIKCERHVTGTINLTIEIDVYNDFQVKVTGPKTLELQLSTRSSDNLSKDQKDLLKALGNLAAVIPLTSMLKLDLLIFSALDEESKATTPKKDVRGRGSVDDFTDNDIPSTLKDEQARKHILEISNGFDLQDGRFEHLRSGDLGISILLKNHVPQNAADAQLYQLLVASLGGAVPAARK